MNLWISWTSLILIKSYEFMNINYTLQIYNTRTLCILWLLQKEYQDTVKSVESLTSFHVLKESVNILLGGCHLQLEVVFSHLGFLQVDALISHLASVTVITSSSVFTCLDLVCAHFLACFHHQQHNSDNYDNHLAIAACNSCLIHPQT